MQDDLQFENRRNLVPAWLASVAVHIILLICISFLAVGTGESSRSDERARPVGIVLAQTSDTSEREYFDETSEVLDTGSAESDDAPNRQPPTLAAAVQSEALVPAELALPSLTDIPLAGVTAIDKPSLTVSNSRPKLPGVDESAIVARAQEELRARAARRGPTTKLSVFGSEEADGNSFIFLIDRSQSMGGGGLGVLQDAGSELVRVLNRLTSKHRFQVAVYHDKTIYLQRRELLPATDEWKSLVPDFLGTKAAFGNTLHKDAILSALSLEPDVIFLLTDGGEPKLKDHEIRAIAKFAAPKTSIHCIQFGSGPLRSSNNFLARLAAATGGEYGYVDVNQRRE